MLKVKNARSSRQPDLIIRSSRLHNFNHQESPRKDPIQWMSRYRSLEIEGRSKSHRAPCMELPIQAGHQTIEDRGKSKAKYENKELHMEIKTQRSGRYNHRHYHKGNEVSSARDYSAEDQNKQLGNGKKARRYLTEAHCSQGNLPRTSHKAKPQLERTDISRAHMGDISEIVASNKENGGEGEDESSILHHLCHLDRLLLHFEAQEQKAPLSMETLATMPSQESLGCDPGSHRQLNLNVYKHRSKKNRNRLRELKNNTLVMRSIEKIKHIFPKGFFLPSEAL